ncbi:hypothetical protein ABPG72_005840 [Tetrahymena utriculariae]
MEINTHRKIESLLTLTILSSSSLRNKISIQLDGTLRKLLVVPKEIKKITLKYKKSSPSQFLDQKNQIGYDELPWIDFKNMENLIYRLQIQFQRKAFVQSYFRVVKFARLKIKIEKIYYQIQGYSAISKFLDIKLKKLNVSKKVNTPTFRIPAKCLIQDIYANDNAQPQN